MAVPKRRNSKRRARLPRAARPLRVPNLRPCPRCSTPGPSHCVCDECGWYNGREVIAKDEF